MCKRFVVQFSCYTYTSCSQLELSGELVGEVLTGLSRDLGEDPPPPPTPTRKKQR